MAIEFNEIPSNIRTPGAYIEVNNQNATTGITDGTKTILVFGQKLSAGTATSNAPVLVTSLQDAITKFGAGSMLAEMFKTLYQSNSFTTTYAMPLDDNGAGVQASGTLTVSGTATAAGTIQLYIGGVLVQAAVANGDSATTVATSIKNAINANTQLTSTATSLNAVVTVTYNHKGLVGNTIDMRLNYRGAIGGETTPAGISVAIVAMANGTSNPTLTTAIAAIPQTIFDYWVFPWTDSTSMTAIENELASRWNGLKMLEGHAVTAYQGSVSTVGSFGLTRNSQHVSVLDAGNGSPTPPHLWAADAIGQIALSATNDPARPFTTLPLITVLPEVMANRRTQSNRNTLLYDGISTYTVSNAGMVMLERVITTYQTNGAGAPDPSYLDATTMFSISKIRQTLRNRLLQKFSRFKLVDDGTRLGAGQAAVSPSIIKAECIALAGEWEEIGLVEDIDAFKSTLVVTRNLSDPTRVDIVLPPNLVNPLYIIAVSLQFIV